MRQTRFTRRYLLRTAAGLAAVVSSAALLEACGQPASAPAATSAPAKPAEPAKPAAPAPTTAPAAPAAAPAATTAPAAAKPADAAKPAAAASGKPVSPIAASGGLNQTTITIIIFSGPEADTHTRLAPKFTEYTKGKVKVQVEEGGRGDAYDAKWLAGMQAKTTAWDVVHDNANRFLGSGPAGFFVPLSKFMADKELFDAEAYNNADFPKALLDVFSYNGEQLLMVQEASGLLFNYRKDLLQKYGVPEPPPEGYDWDTYVGHLKTIQDGLAKDGKADVFPLLLGAKKPGHANIHIVQNAWAKGGQIFDGVNPTYDDPMMVEQAQFLIDLMYKNKFISEGAVGYEYPDVLTGFQTGKAVTAFQWNAAAPTFLDASKSPETAGKIGFSALPYFKDKGGKINRFHPSPHGIGVSAYSKQQKEAFAYCAWFTSQETARDYVTNGGGSSGRASLLTDKDVLAKNPQYLALNEVLKLQHPYPPLEQYNYVYNTILAAHTSAIWSKQETPAAGLAAANKEAIQYLKEQGVIK
jgi:ABC-type glycerol-3-phosphate transport system substrate-binding protein